MPPRQEEAFPLPLVEPLKLRGGLMLMVTVIPAEYAFIL